MAVSLKCIFSDFDVRRVVEVNVTNMKPVVPLFFGEHKFVIFNSLLDQEINSMGHRIPTQTLRLTENRTRESTPPPSKY